MHELERYDVGISQEVRARTIELWKDRFRSILAAAPAMEKADPDKLEFLSAYLLGALVQGPRIRTWLDVPKTAAARRAHIERVRDLLADGLPLLRSPAPGDRIPPT
jgi:hypothetical protein